MTDITSNLKSCLGLHPALSMSFNDLEAGLNAEVAKGNLKCQSKGNLRLYDYTIQCSFEKNWNKFTLMSRGLIIDIWRKSVVALCLPKFFNFGEVLYCPENEPFRATTKYDGSMIVVWAWNNRWNCSTRGSFESDQAKWAKKWLYENVDLSSLVPGRTYIFEGIYTENRIVIPYDFEGLVLITGYDQYGYEFLYEDMAEYAWKMGVRPVESHNFNSINEMLSKAKTLPSNKEGWVVRFDNGYRLKIKGDEYVRLHKLISNCTPLSVWDMMRNCQDLEPILAELPEEFEKDIRTIQALLQHKENKFLHDIFHLYQETLFMSDKEVGLKRMELREKHGDVVDFVFPCRKMQFLEKYDKPGKVRDLLYRKFRPTGNVLEGYIPSTAINRFSEEEK